MADMWIYFADQRLKHHCDSAVSTAHTFPFLNDFIHIPAPKIHTWPFALQYSQEMKQEHLGKWLVTKQQLWVNTVTTKVMKVNLILT